MSSQKDIVHQEDEAEPKVNGLAQHEESVKTLEEIKAEKRFVLKVDLMILPILIIMFFLASLVRTGLLELDSCRSISELRAPIGPWRRCECLYRWTAERVQDDCYRAKLMSLALLRWLPRL